MAKREMEKRRRKLNASVIVVAMVVTVMIGGVWISTNSLHTKLDSYHEREKVLENQIEAEKARSEEIEEHSKYVQTNAYIEQIAKEKLGLVYEDEIIFKKEN